MCVRLPVMQAPEELPGPQTSGFPRAMMMMFNNFSDQQRVMEAARRLKDIRQDEATIHFFPDFAAATQKRPWEHNQVRKKLQSIEGAHCAMIYPASQRVTVNDMVKTFHTPEEAAAFVDSVAILGCADEVSLVMLSPDYLRVPI
ncbi:hypothetical protein GOODEAATRI_001414 [Goodea atripinnis]|uniref:Uncharacterized protein n=1 Tax=Goodea atripinnis TaxID=208336 RepID=A0ABV0PAJ6_9TELE